jgi:hypothetical protein
MHVDHDTIADVTRQIEKGIEALQWAQQAFEHESEKNAALHLATKVLYVPIVGKIDEARRALGSAIDRLNG